MIKQLHCLISVFALLLVVNLPKAMAEEEDFSGCCKPPIDLIYWCTDLPYDFNPWNTYQLQALFGKPQNMCYTNVWVELEPTVNLTNCETGTITRHFKVSGHYGYEYCDQKITIKGVHNYDIQFPADIEVSCGEVPAAEELRTNEGACDLLAISVEDENYSLSGSGCGKIFRTYRVINWCEYNGLDDKVVISRDEDCDGAPGDEPVWVLRRSDGYAYIDRDNYENNNNPRAGEKGCSPTNPKGYWRKVRSTGYWEYTQHIKINDKVAPIVSIEQPNPICSYNNTCDANVKIPFSVWDDCTPNDIKIKVFIDGTKTAEYAKGGSYFASGAYKVGSHEVEVHATDGCGNSTIIKTPFKVVDCKAPAPICINGITVTLMPTPPNTDVDGNGSIDQGAMTIWAKDLIASQVTDCSGIAGFSINRVGEQASIDKTNLVITCEDLGTLNVEIYAWDKANNPYAVQPDGTIGGRNYSFCRTYILVQANNNLCGAPAKILGSVAGVIQTEDQHSLDSVSVTLMSTDSLQQTTDAAGSYRFDSLEMHNAYRIVPSLNSNIAEGISLSDLIVLQKHILGTELIASPYRLIAADVDRSGNISTADLLELRQILLGTSDHFTNNTSWRFVDAAYHFPDPANPWSEPFPEEIGILEMTEASVNNGNFVAIKIGDVNGSIMADREAVSNRSAEVTPLKIANQVIEAGDFIEVPVQLPTPVEAAQFELNFDANVLEMTGLQYQLAQAENLNLNKAKAGIIRVIWDADLQTYSTTPNTLFTIRFRAVQTAQLREALHLNEQHLRAIAQQKDGTQSSLALQFSTGQSTEAFALYPNAPNPFRDETVLSFRLPEASRGTVSIYDLTGKLIWQQSGNFAKGLNKMLITRASLNADGVLLYTLQTEDHHASGKMVVLPR